MTRNVRVRTMAAAVTAAVVPVLTAGATVQAAPDVPRPAVQPATIAPASPTGVAAPGLATRLPAVASPGDSAMLDRPAERGRGVLVVENGTTQDAYVTLARDGRAVKTDYVRAGATEQVSDVPDGEYVLFVDTGTGWNRDRREFTSNARSLRFNETFPFSTTESGATVWTVGLRPVRGGNASTVPVPPSSVPR